MATVANISETLFKHAPYELKMDFDNVGHLAGRADREVSSVLVALDITDDVIEEAKREGAELIVSHHPLTFSGLKSVTDRELTGVKFVSILEGGMSAICMHTNLDAAEGGVNDTLASVLGAKLIGVLNQDEGVSRICELEQSMPFFNFLAHVKSVLGANGLRYAGPERAVKLIGICGGAGAGDIFLAAERGCDTYLTADVKHHEFIFAHELGINLIDAGHFPTERVVLPVLKQWLEQDFPSLKVKISQTNVQQERFFV